MMTATDLYYGSIINARVTGGFMDFVEVKISVLCGLINEWVVYCILEAIITITSILTVAQLVLLTRVTLYASPTMDTLSVLFRYTTCSEKNHE